MVPRRRLYRVLTAGLALRVSPDVAAARTGVVLLRGEVFEASIIAPGVDGRVYLKPQGMRGWVFDDSAVDPADPSVEPLGDDASAQAAPLPPRGAPLGTEGGGAVAAAFAPAGGWRCEGGRPATSAQSASFREAMGFGPLQRGAARHG